MSTRETTSTQDRSAALLRQRIRTVFTHLPMGLAGDQDAIHQMRIAGRRLRVALPLVSEKPGGHRVKRALSVLRELTRTAGASRDLDVGLALYEERLRTVAHPTAHQLTLRRRLRTTRSRRRSHTAGALLDLEIAKLRRDLRKTVARPAADIFSVLARMRDLRDSQGAALMTGFAELGDRFDPETLHALRRRARRLRYAAEVSDTLRGEDSGAPALWKQLQDHIGNLHDRHVLAGWLQAQAEAAAAGAQPGLAAAARAERAFFVTEARRFHQELLEERPADLAGQALDAMGRNRPAA